MEEDHCKRIETIAFSHLIHSINLSATHLHLHCSWVWESDGSDVLMGTPHWDACERDPNGSTWQNYLCICPPDYYFRDCANDAMMYGICQVEV